MTRNMGYGEFSDFYFSRQPKYGHSKNVLKYPPIGAILRGVLQLPPEGVWDQTIYGYGHTPWVLDQPWYQNRVTRFGLFPLGFEGLANEHLITITNVAWTPCIFSNKCTMITFSLLFEHVAEVWEVHFQMRDSFKGKNF